MYHSSQGLSPPPFYFLPQTLWYNLQIGSVALKIFKCRQCIPAILLPPRPLIYTNLNPLYSRLFCAMVAWYWPRSSLNKDFVNVPPLAGWNIVDTVYTTIQSIKQPINRQWIFSYFVIISLWKQTRLFIRTDLYSLKDVLCLDFKWNLSEIGPVVLENFF